MYIYIQYQHDKHNDESKGHIFNLFRKGHHKKYTIFFTPDYAMKALHLSKKQVTPTNLR